MVVKKIYVIVVYDISVERIDAVRTFLRRYLNWVQNSVFEGELTESEMMLVDAGIKERIDVETDSVLIYSLKTDKFLDRKEIGAPRASISTII